MFHERSSIFNRWEKDKAIDHQNMMMLRKLVAIKRGQRPSVDIPSVKEVRSLNRQESVSRNPQLSQSGSAQVKGGNSVARKLEQDRIDRENLKILHKIVAMGSARDDA